MSRGGETCILTEMPKWLLITAASAVAVYIAFVVALLLLGRRQDARAWAGLVLDCPTYFALYMDGELPNSVLARLTARIDAPVVAGEDHVVIAWAIERDGRKHHAGSAVLSPDGKALAVARALLIEPRDG